MNIRFPRRFKSTVLVVFFILNTFCSFSATKTWTNTAGGAWTTAGNWSPSGAPANGDDVIIPTLSGSTNSITAVPTITLNSLTFTGTGFGWIAAGSSGNIVTISTTWSVSSGYTLTIGASGGRLVWTIGSGCLATLNGYVAFDAGTTNRNFTVNGTLIVNTTGMIYDPNPSGGSDFYLNSGATLKTQKSQGITTISATSATNINFNVAISVGGSYSYAPGANYEYNGTSNQTTGTGLNQNIPNSVVVNMTAGKTLSLTGSTTISGSLTLTSGMVDLNSNILTLGTSTSSLGTLSRSSDFLFNGTFRRWFGTATVSIPSNTGLFPMGTSSGDYRPLWFGYTSTLTTAGILSAVHTATYPATYVAAGHNDASWGNNLQGVSNSVWTVAASTLVVNGATSMLRYGGTGFGNNTLADLNASLASSVLGTHGAATNANTTYEVNRTGLTTANLGNGWRIGTRNTTASPLPITLINFTANYMDAKNVKLDWSTASESNSDYFVIERTKNGEDIEVVGKMPASGTTSSRHEYVFFDEYPLQGISYYRLKQFNIDGSDESFPWAIINSSPDADVVAFPNPGNGIVNLRLKGILEEEVISVEVYNSLGYCIYRSGSFSETINISDKQTGICYLHIKAGDKTITRKLLNQSGF